MTTAQLLTRLAGLNVTLFVKGDQLRYRAPAGTVTDDLRDAIASCRSEIIERLRVPTEGTVTQCSMCDYRNWIDAPPVDGRIRTACGVCGRFIGYRPAGP
jgi:hypothetical protein